MPPTGAHNTGGNYEPLTGAVLLGQRPNIGASPYARLYSPFGAFNRPTITIDRNDRGDTLKLVQITDLTRARTDGAASAMAKACFQTLPSRDGGRRSQAATTWWLRG